MLYPYYYRGTPLNGHPWQVDTHDIILKVPTVLPFTSILKQPLNSGHPATRYNRQFSWSQLYASNNQRPRFSGHSSTFSARLSTITAVVHNLTLDLVLLIVVLASAYPSLPVYSKEKLWKCSQVVLNSRITQYHTCRKYIGSSWVRDTSL